MVLVFLIVWFCDLFDGTGMVFVGCLEMSGGVRGDKWGYFPLGGRLSSGGEGGVWLACGRLCAGLSMLVFWRTAQDCVGVLYGAADGVFQIVGSSFMYGLEGVRYANCLVLRRGFADRVRAVVAGRLTNELSYRTLRFFVRRALTSTGHLCGINRLGIQVLVVFFCG